MSELMMNEEIDEMLVTAYKGSSRDLNPDPIDSEQFSNDFINCFKYDTSKTKISARVWSSQLESSKIAILVDCSELEKLYEIRNE